ncbi:hypothetical protein ACFQT4_08385 [Pseudoduganella danionis]|uniref:hypothetical protein n=1 Tax=Pseudoduganella danionis TaxID=1890295 RepID=UPI0036133BE8
MVLQGGSGNDNWAHVWSDYNGTTATNQRIEAKSVQLYGGGVTTDSQATFSNNDARLSSNGSQQLIADSLLLKAAGGPVGMAAAGDQTFTITGSLSLIGGSYAGTANLSSNANINSTGNQTINAGSIDMQAGSTGSRNGAFIQDGSTDPSGKLQKITASTITLKGGNGGSNNNVLLYAYGDHIQQQINTNELLVSGGASGQSNRARVQAIGNVGSDADQVINAGRITLTGAGRLLNIVMMA